MIENVLGVLGFFISLINLVYFFVIRINKLTVRFGTYGIRDYSHNKNMLLIHYQFTNNSQLSNSITRVTLILNNTNYNCEYRSNVAETFTIRESGKVVEHQTTYTDILPINLAPLESHSGFLSFAIPQGILSTNEKCLTFQICTSRGKVIQKTFSLHEDTTVR